MNVSKLLAELRAERSHLDKAISALEGLDGAPRRAPGRRRRRRGRMSAAGRKRISEMMKARWAARRKAKRKS
jgi:hypothetical protein